MTKTLTEQYKFGEIKTGYYWCKIWGEDSLVIKWLVRDNEIHQSNLIEEVLAPVPSYDEWERLQKQLNEANEVIKKFETTEIGHKQKDGTYMLTVCGVIIDPEKRPTSALVQKETYFYDPRPLTKYLEKWGVK